MFDKVNALIINVQTRAAARQEGQALVEYGLVIGLISIVGIAAAGALTGGLEDLFTTIGGALTAVTVP